MDGWDEPPPESTSRPWDNTPANTDTTTYTTTDTTADTMSGATQHPVVNTQLKLSIPSDSTRPRRYSILVDVNADLFDRPVSSSIQFEVRRTILINSSQETGCYRYIGPAELTWHDDVGVKHMAVSLKLAAQQSDAKVPVRSCESHIKTTTPVQDPVPPALAPSKFWHRKHLQEFVGMYSDWLASKYGIAKNDGGYIDRVNQVWDAAVEDDECEFIYSKSKLIDYAKSYSVKQPKVQGVDP